MPPPITRAEDFLEVVRRSGVLDDEQLDEFLAARPADSPPPAPAELAELLVRAGLLTPFQASQLLQGKWKGFRIAGKYRLLELLGVGGMGRVYLCEHLRMRRRVALKVLPAGQSDDPAALKRFDREARAVAALSHPNIVQAYDIDHDGKMHFLVMEYVDGVSLQEFVARNGPADPARAAHCVAQAALGLQHAHEAGLVHRDIKPGNLLLARDGTVKVLDLGLARFFHDANDKLTRQYDEKSVLGTADYLAPEQAIDSSAVDIRADIYSLGATFYFLLTGRPPFADGTIAQKLFWHQMREPDPITSVRHDVPEGMAAVMARMMAKDPAARYQEPNDVADALAEWTRVPLPPPTDSQMPPRTAPRPDGATLLRPRSVPAGLTRATPFPADEETPPEPRPRLADEGRPARRWPLLLAAGAGVVLLAGLALLGWRVWGGHGDAKPGGFRPRGVGSQVLIVDRTGGPGKFASVAAALAECQSGDRVSVAESPWEETLRLSAGSVPAGSITLEGRTPAGETVVLRPGPDHKPGEPLLRVEGVSSLRVERLTLDGQNRCDHLVEVSGACHGFALESCVLQAFRRSGVHCREAAGQPTQPVVLRKLHVVAGDQYAVGVSLSAGKDKAVRHLELRDGLFEGSGRAAVLVAGDLAGVSCEGNRVSGLRSGVLFSPRDQPLKRTQCRWANNTFHLLPAAFEFEKPPPAAKSSADALSVTNNLFIEVTKLVQLPGDLPGDRLDGVAGIANVYGTAPAPPAGAALLGAKEASVADVNLRPGDGPLFLRYPRGSPLATAGADGVPVGVPPE